jgi:hypothetical protein
MFTMFESCCPVSAQDAEKRLLTPRLTACCTARFRVTAWPTATLPRFHATTLPCSVPAGAEDRYVSLGSTLSQTDTALDARLPALPMIKV